MKSKFSVAVVVVTFNSEDLISDLVASLPQGIGGSTEWKLVVADNDSRDQTVRVLQEVAPNCTVVQMGYNAGYAAGINAAVRAAGAHQAYLILNPDVRLMPDCLPNLLTSLAQTGIGIAVPRLIDADGELILSMRREPSVLRAFGDLLLGAERAGKYPAFGEIVSDSKAYDRVTVTSWAEGSTQLVSGECWDLCGPWDESFFLYSEETDFNLRAGGLGFSTLYTPTAQAVHLEGGSATSPQLWSLLQVNRVRLYARRHGVLPTVAFWLATVLREASRSLMGRRPSRTAFCDLVRPNSWLTEPGAHTTSAKVANRETPGPG